LASRPFSRERITSSSTKKKKKRLKEKTKKYFLCENNLQFLYLAGLLFKSNGISLGSEFFFDCYELL
jgi:hypothetical protein